VLPFGRRGKIRCINGGHIFLLKALPLAGGDQKCTRCGRTWKIEVGVDYLRMAGAKAGMKRVMGFRKPF